MESSGLRVGVVKVGVVKVDQGEMQPSAGTDTKFQKKVRIFPFHFDRRQFAMAAFIKKSKIKRNMAKFFATCVITDTFPILLPAMVYLLIFIPCSRIECHRCILFPRFASSRTLRAQNDKITPPQRNPV